MAHSTERSRELEFKLLYAIVVAGKSARFADGAMGRLEDCFRDDGCWDDRGWFHAIRIASELHIFDRIVQDARIGNYQKNKRAMAVASDSPFWMFTFFAGCRNVGTSCRGRRRNRRSSTRPSRPCT